MSRFKRTKRRFTRNCYGSTGFVEIAVEVDKEGWVDADIRFHGDGHTVSLSDAYGQTNTARTRRATLRELHHEIGQAERLKVDLDIYIQSVYDAINVISSTPLDKP